MTRRKTDEERWKRPCWTRGFLWLHGAPSRTPSATSTETAPPLASVPTSELNSITANATINAHPELFKIVTPINVDKFESLLVQHPNRPLVNSVCRSLREGAWPFAIINKDDPITFDFSERTLDDPTSDFVQGQRDIEILEGRYSHLFRSELLP